MSRSPLEYSVHARAVLGMLGMMGAIGFMMVQSKPSPEMQAALDELVQKGAVECKPNRARCAAAPNAVEYRGILPRKEMVNHWAWLRQHEDDPDLKFNMTVPV